MNTGTSGALAGKVVVVTGSTRGLGRAIAEGCGRAGARVVVSSRGAEAVAEAVAALRASGLAATGQTCDVADLAQVRALRAHAEAAFGPVDVWINNAGLSAPYGPTAHVPPDRYLQVLRTNIFGAYHGSLVAMESFVPRRRGKLINLLGRGDRRPVPMQSAYASSKAWARAFSAALSKEYAGAGIGVFMLNPGLVDTDLLRHVEALQGYEEQVRPLRTVGWLWANPPALPARRAVWLASAATDGKTGIELQVLGPAGLLGGLLRAALGRLTGRPRPPFELDVRGVPPHLPLER